MKRAGTGELQHNVTVDWASCAADEEGTVDIHVRCTKDNVGVVKEERAGRWYSHHVEVVREARATPNDHLRQSGTSASGMQGRRRRAATHPAVFWENDIAVGWDKAAGPSCCMVPIEKSSRLQERAALARGALHTKG